MRPYIGCRNSGIIVLEEEKFGPTKQVKGNEVRRKDGEAKKYNRCFSGTTKEDLQCLLERFEYRAMEKEETGVTCEHACEETGWDTDLLPDFRKDPSLTLEKGPMYAGIPACRLLVAR
mmetsp:Transcript_5937/g.9110  ORF Transcript_5937/g.9110 Transcript_5937/m.9110 type:complete len:118 (-) Transcript_5937:73-426(-)